jgi:hypothetical protein
LFSIWIWHLFLFMTVATRNVFIHMMKSQEIFAWEPQLREGYMRAWEFRAIRHCCSPRARHDVLEPTPTPRALPQSPGSPWFPQGSPLRVCLRATATSPLARTGGGNTTSVREGNGFTATSHCIKELRMRPGIPLGLTCWPSAKWIWVQNLVVFVYNWAGWWNVRIRILEICTGV